jgi:signal-transduction protein with cAMP-binding, CBS, and nucleotidyltransferase domain
MSFVAPLRVRRPPTQSTTTTAPETSSFAGLGQLRIVDAMHKGIVSCRPDTPLHSVARMMATYRVHAIIVAPRGQQDREPGLTDWRVITDSDVLRVAENDDLEDVTADTVATTPILAVRESDGLQGAAQLLRVLDASHLVVVGAHSRKPIGVLSKLDVMRALAGFPERHPSIPRGDPHSVRR